MPQFLFDAISLIAQLLLIESSMNRYRQMANVLHFNAKGSALQGEFRSVFEFQAMAQEDEGKVLLHLAQEVQHLRFFPVCAGILGYNKVKELRTEAFSELLGCHNYFRAD